MRDGWGQCVTAVSSSSAGPDPVSQVKHMQLTLWAKPQPGGAEAVFLMSNQDNTIAPATVEIDLR